jgi:hypothetical protein
MDSQVVASVVLDTALHAHTFTYMGYVHYVIG